MYKRLICSIAACVLAIYPAVEAFGPKWVFLIGEPELPVED